MKLDLLKCHPARIYAYGFQLEPTGFQQTLINISMVGEKTNMEVIPVKYLNIKNLTFAKIYSYLLSDNGGEHELAPDAPEKIFAEIHNRFQGQAINNVTSRFRLGKYVCTVRFIRAENFCSFINIITYEAKDVITRQWSDDMRDMISALHQVLSFYPEALLADYDILSTGPFRETRECYTFLQKMYAESTGERVVDCGISYSRVVMAKIARESPELVQVKRFVLIPFDCSSEEALELLHDMLGDLALISVFEGKLKRHYDAYLKYVTKVRDIEENTARRVEEISDTLKGSVPLAHLEEWLASLSREFSDLSLLASQLTTEQTKAQTSMLNSQTVYAKWNERSFSTFPTVSANAMRNSEIVQQGFQNVIESVEITRNKLGDLLTIIRTYINIEQQRQSIRLQRSLESTMKDMGVIMREAETRRVEEQRQSNALENLSYIFAGFGLAEVIANLSVIFLTESAVDNMNLGQQIVIGLSMLIGILTFAIFTSFIVINSLRKRQLRALERTKTVRAALSTEMDDDGDGEVDSKV